MNKRKLTLIILGVVVAFILLVSILVWIFILRIPDPKPVEYEENETTSEETQADIPVLSESTKSLIDASEIEIDNEQMIAAVIENHVDSRKQMQGLYDASLVMEMEAEGGITRFLAFYPYQNIEKVGPIRSIRPYFVRWAEMFDTALAHAGASEMGFSAIYTSGRIFDLDGLALEGGLRYFTRDYMYYAPHNLYANLQELRELMDERGWEKSIEEEFFKFGDLDDSTLSNSDIENAEILHIYYPSPSYFVTYEYDQENETYLRYQGGAPHIDSGNNEQIEISNVVVLITNYYPTDSVGRLYMKTEGKGDMYLIREGKVFPGTWKRTTSQEKISFYDANNDQLKFKEGKTWISIIDYQKGLQWE